MLNRPSPLMTNIIVTPPFGRAHGRAHGGARSISASGVSAGGVSAGTKEGLLMTWDLRSDHYDISGSIDLDTSQVYLLEPLMTWCRCAISV
jgi:hypothetical protein